MGGWTVSKLDFALVNAQLAQAELELYAWATGERSTLNEMMSVENFVGDASNTGPGIGPDRSETLLRTAQRDAAELDAAMGRVKALRMLLDGSRV